MDHSVPEKTTMFGAAVEAGSLNFGVRTAQQMEIVLQNHRLVKRIQMCKPTYDRRQHLEDARERERWLWNQAIANRPLDQAARVRRPPSRPHSAAAALERPRLVGASGRAGVGGSASTSGLGVPGRPAKPWPVPFTPSMHPDPPVYSVHASGPSHVLSARIRPLPHL